DGADLRLDRADAVVERRDLVADRRLALSVGVERALEVRDVRVDRGLLCDVVAECRRRDGEQEQKRDGNPPRHEVEIRHRPTLLLRLVGIQCLERLSGGAPQRAHERPVVLVVDRPGAMVEFEFLECRKGAVALVDQAQPALGRRADLVGLVVAAEKERQGAEDDGGGCKERAKDQCRPPRARASRATSLRCSRASGHSATSDPARKTKPASQIRFTSGLISTLKKTYLPCCWSKMM